MTLRFVMATRYGEALPASAEDDTATEPVPGDFAPLAEHPAAERFHAGVDIPTQALALMAYCYALFRRCTAQPPVDELAFDIVSAHQFSYDDYRDSDALRPDLLSHPDHSPE